MLNRPGGEDLADRASGGSTRGFCQGGEGRKDGEVWQVMPLSLSNPEWRILQGALRECGKGSGALSFAASGEPLGKATDCAQGIIGKQMFVVLNHWSSGLFVTTVHVSWLIQCLTLLRTSEC